MYKLIQPTPDLPVSAAIKLSDGTSFPFNPANTDYQTYLKWLEEGNQPILADEPTQGVA